MKAHVFRRIPRAASILALFTSSLALGCSDDKPATPGPTPDPTGPLGDRADLPVTDRIKIDRLAGPVDAVRDKFGRFHVYAASLADALRVEGYLVAQDRHLQIEFFRRVSEGRLAEILADADASVIDTDISFRHLGLHRVAKKQYAALNPEDKALLDAYADGITQYFQALRNGDAVMPPAQFLIPTSAFTDFTGEDALAIARLQSYLLSYSGDSEIVDTRSIGYLQKAFPADSTDPKIAKRAGIIQELYRLAPWDPTTTTTGYPTGNKPGPHKPAARPDATVLADQASIYLDSIRRVKDMIAPEGFGSNNWAVSAMKSASGHALVASDPHLSLSAPAVFWPVALHVSSTDPKEKLDVSGLSFPGIPGIILGHNEHIGWGATVAAYDVTDAYAETLTPDGKNVVFGGKNIPIETIDEVITIQGGDPYTYKVQVVPHHGAILPQITATHTVAPLDPTKGAISIKWTGDEPTNELSAVLNLLRANNVDEAKAALDGFQVGAQNWMIGDSDGNILWTSHAKVPTRATGALAWDPTTYAGTLPCLVLPGDGSAEWTGALPDGLVPWEKNPTAGFLATANNDPIGESLDNDPTNGTLPDGTPSYLGCAWDIGFRVGRIQERLKGLEKATPDDLSKIQGDVKSSLGSRLAPVLVDAINRAEAERATPGTNPDLTKVVADPLYDPMKIGKVRDLLTAWGMESSYEAAAGIDLDTNMPLPESGATAAEARAAQATVVFNNWLYRFIERVIGDEHELAGRPSIPRDQKAKAILALCTNDPKTLPTFDPSTMDSALWDDLATPEIESRYDRAIRALLDALDSMTKQIGPDISAYRWGDIHRIRFEALIPVLGQLSIPPTGDPLFPKGFPRHGDNFSVDSSDTSLTGKITQTPDFTYDFGPTQRFVIELDPAGPKVVNALPGGAVWDSQSEHFRDEAELWRRNQTHAVPFLLTDVVKAAEARFVMIKP